MLECYRRFIMALESDALREDIQLLKSGKKSEVELADEARADVISPSNGEVLGIWLMCFNLFRYFMEKGVFDRDIHKGMPKNPPPPSQFSKKYANQSILLMQIMLFSL